MVAQLDLEWEVSLGDEMVDPLSISCNLTCCKYSDNDDDVVCFSDLNFTEYKNLTTWAPWELAVRWTFASLIVLVAVLANLAIIIILTKNRLLLRTSVNHFILNMSVADLILALTGPIPFTVRDTSMFWPLGEAWCYLEGYIQMVVMLVSLESLATISCDRMIGVVRPFHTHLKTWQSLAIIIIIWVSSALLAVPWGLYRVYTIRMWKDRTESNCGEKETLYVWWMALVGLAWLSLAIMLVCYSTILAYFRHPRYKNVSKREHPVMTHLKKRVVKMMFLLVVTFAVCWLPMQLLNIFHTNFLNDFGGLKDDASKRNYAALMTVSQYMIYVNPVVNPVIYGLLHQNFRRAFRLTFPCIFTRKSTLVLTRGQGVTRYMWSVRSTGSQPSVTGQHRHSNERQVQPYSSERNTTTPLRRLSGSETLSDEAQRNSHVSSEDERKRRKKCCILKPRRLARQKSKKEDRGSPENDNDGRFCSAGSSFVNEKYVRDLAQKISIVSKGALGHLITEVIEEETSSDAERERVL